VTEFTGVHSGEQREAGREGETGAGSHHGDEALLQGLAQGFEGVAPELRQLVEEEDAVVRQARLAWTGVAAAADHPGRAGAGVRAAERAVLEQARRGFLRHQRVDLGDGDGLRQGEGWQQAGQAAGEHRLARARRPEKEEVVPAGGRHFEGPFGRLLASHLREIGAVGPGASGEQGSGDRGDRLRPGQVVDGFGQAEKADHRHRAQSGGLRGVGRRQQHLAAGEAPPEVGDGEAAADGADGSVQAELAADEPAVERFLGELVVGHQHRQGNGEIEVVAFLAQVGGSEIDDDGLGIQVEAAVLDGGSHPLAALAYRGIGESHDLNLWESVVDVDFDLDGAGLNAPWRSCRSSG